MSLLDFAGSRLTWHLDWPEVRPSMWYTLSMLADLAPAFIPLVASAEAGLPASGHLKKRKISYAKPIPAPEDWLSGLLCVQGCLKMLRSGRTSLQLRGGGWPKTLCNRARKTRMVTRTATEKLTWP
jgi:hypothetical protein